ncbi:MAG: hypothetical protein AB7S81_08180 [Bdellovibrionales bacterium]
MRLNGWTLERRKQQAEAIQRWQPWERSTGPRTAQGKEKASRNAFKGGGWLKERQLIKKLNLYLREQEHAREKHINDLYSGFA